MARDRTSTSDKVRVAAGVTGIGVGLGLIGAGEYLKRNPEAAARVNERFNEIAKVRMGGTPNEIGRTASEKLEILARRAKGTPEGDVALRKLTAARAREVKTFTGRAKKVISKIHLSAREELDQVIELGLPQSNLSRLGKKRRKRVIGESILRARGLPMGMPPMDTHLSQNKFTLPLSARDALNEIQFIRGKQVAGLFANEPRMAPGANSFYRAIETKGGKDAKDVARAAKATRIFLKSPILRAQAAMRDPRYPARLLSARDNLNAIIELKAVDLGYTYGSEGMAAPCAENYATKKHYPSLYISDREDEIDLPLSGTAKVRFKTRSKTSRQDEGGKKRHSADIEIQSIDVIEADEAPSKKLKEGAPAKLNTYSARDQLTDIIQFGEGEAVGTGISSALNKLRRLNKPLGAGSVAKRKFYPRQWDRIGQIKPAPIKSLSDKLDGIIALAADPRPRNRLGMFDGADEGPDPNAIGEVYKARTVGQNLVGGAVAGVGAAASGTAVKALFSKLKKAKV